MKKLAVVTGANRGLGFETCRQLAQRDIQVILTSRDRVKGQTAVDKLQAEKLDVKYHPLDVTNPESIESLSQFISKEFGHLDILVNNAGILTDWVENPDGDIFKAKVDTLRQTIETNVYGPLQLCQQLIPLMKVQNYGRVVNLSSSLGKLSSNMDFTVFPTYGITKTAVNAVTVLFANALKDTNILINSVNPGWVQTDMGGPHAIRTIAEGVDTIVWLATLPDGGPTGGFFQDKNLITW
ncbi:SDR family oxidoreductase [Microcoleus sp. N3A4]|uniref:SDR family oxidoreductase n=1 Tax=Microcoleus sp. N3A4 TaxID=3055379 RepID=UPI002FD4CE1D